MVWGDLSPMEFLDLLNPENSARQDGGAQTQIIAECGWNYEAGGYNADSGYYLFYFGMRQPALRNLNLPDGTVPQEPNIDYYKQV
jgi:hypothetical protein